MIRKTYQRLLGAGKPKKVALCACARKLLIKLNSLATEQIRPAQRNPTMLPGGKPVVV